MELENTTVMSVLVGLAGILAEIVFRDTLASSVLGVVLGIVLAVIILCCAYFALDGLQRSSMAVRKKEENRKREYDEKLFRLLNKKLSDQIKLEKGIYSLLARGTKTDVPVSVPDDSGERWESLVEDIDSSMLKAAKLIIKNAQKSQEESGRMMEQNSEELLQAIRSVGNQLQMLNGEIQELAERAVTLPEASVQAGPAADALPEEIPQAAEISGQEMDLEDVDVDRMMEELFQSDVAAEPEDAADTAELEPESDVLESAPEETEFNVGTDTEAVPQEPETVTQGEAETDMEWMPDTASYSDVPDTAEDLPDLAMEEMDNITEEDLDSLLDGLLPEPEPLDEPEPEKTGGGLTALDMLLGKQKEDVGEETSGPEPTESANDAAVNPEQPATSVDAAVNPEQPAMSADAAVNPEQPEISVEADQNTVSEGENGSSKREPEAVSGLQQEEPKQEPAPEPVSSDPGKMMSPDDIAALLASMDS